jgi:CHAT domain-containing protein/tetratricopeptide (TPR) repeat protein
MSKSMGSQLISAFFKALALVDRAQCLEILQSLDDLAQQDPAFQNWHTYLTGIMANEFQRNWAESERLFKSLLIQALDTSFKSRVLVALGRTYDYQGRWHEALSIYEQCAADLFQSNQSIEQAKIWKNMAITLQKGFAQGDFSEKELHQAVLYCENALQSLHSLSKRSKDDRWLEATIWNTLGGVHFSLGNWDIASHCYKEFRTLSRAVRNPYAIGMANQNLGEVLHRQDPKMWRQALWAYTKALQSHRKFNDTYQEIDVLANLAALHSDMGAVLKAHDYYEQAIQLIESMRAGVTSEEARAGFFATVSDIYANAVLLYLELNDAAGAFNLVERARSRTFLDMLAAHSPTLADQVEAPTMTLIDVQAALPEDALLIEYFTTGLAEARTSKGVQRHRFPPAKTIIFAITRDTIQVHDARLSPEALRMSQPNTILEKPFLELQTRRAMYERLIAPCAPLLAGKHRLYLVPYGPLHYIPFQALISPAGTTLLHEAGPQLIYGPSASVLFRYGRAAAGRASESCLALGFNGNGENRLNFGEEEARNIAKLTGGHSLIGSIPKKETLYKQASRYRLLHFSCHGTFNPESPLDSALLLASNQSLTASDVLEYLHLECDLVILSACESGLSRVRRGDELIGLVRAFMYAGTPALICTLWRVDERSTRILMESFYQEIQGGTGYAEALKRAQIYLMNLTRRQARELLVHYWTTEYLGHIPSVDTATPRLPSRATLSRRAGAYLKGLAPANTREQTETLLEGADDEHVFANPYYWAPFILIGDHGSV